MSAPAIRVESLSKRYRLGRDRGRYRTLRESIVRAATAPLRLIRAASASAPEADGADEVWALRDVSFDVREGEVVGVIGRNGAGKSTLLKVLSRITEPTDGRALVRGRVASLLEVGTGFHPELTGRENTYLSGAILGMKRREIARKFDDIVAFAEVEAFLDTPVKRYSSGMYMRLAFSVAAHLEPDILVIDEVLAVGDAAFQKKCLGRMGEMASGGRTVIFVSHNMGAIQSMCDRAIWIQAGRVEADGPAAAIAERYMSAIQTSDAPHAGKKGDLFAVERITLRNARGEPAQVFAPGEPLTVEIHFRTSRRLERPYVWVYVQSQFGALFVASMAFDGLRPEALDGAGVLACTMRLPFLLPQTYTVRVGARSGDGSAPLLESDPFAYFQVACRMRDHGFLDERADQFTSDSTPAIVPYEWRYPDGTTARVEPRLGPVGGPGAREVATRG